MGIIYDAKPAVYHSGNIHPGLSVEEMRERHLSKSVLWAWHPNPMRWLNAPGFEGNSSTDWGSLVDCLLLTPQLFAKEYSVGEPFPSNKEHMDIVEALRVAPDRAVMSEFAEFRTNVAKAWKAEQEAAGRVIVRDPAALELAKEHIACDGLTRISEAKYRDAQAAAEAVRGHEAAGHLLDTSDTQVALYGELCGVMVKALVDIAPQNGTHHENALADLKTFRGWDKGAFARQVGALGYHVQAAWYLDLWNAVTGENRDEWLFVVSENTAPYTCNVFRLNPDAIEAGREWYRKALADWKEMLDTGMHFSPYAEIEDIDLKKWDYLAIYGSEF